MQLYLLNSLMIFVVLPANIGPKITFKYPPSKTVAIFIIYNMLFKWLWLKLNINFMYTLNCLTNINLNVIKARYIMNHCPWVEKYRPSTLENIVLDDMNKTILQNIIIKNTFPNLLFYGPPGTGKTTTIINLIEKYQEVYNQQDTSLKIHLNASDERGIEVIRNQINNFVNTKHFTKG